MAGVWLWVRTGLRGRWLAWLGVGVMIGVAGGAALSFLAGARRTASSFDRFRDEAVAPHALVSATPDTESSLLDAVDRPFVPIMALLLAVPAGLVLANVLAFLPGRAVARLRPALVLGGE